MNTAKVHVKNRPSLTSNLIPEESLTSSDVIRLILDAQRTRKAMLVTSAGAMPHIAPSPQFRGIA
jgi:hypothetical protein